MIQELLELLTGEWSQSLEAAGCRLKTPLCAMKASGTGSDRKVNFLVFENKNFNPVLLLKLARSSGYELRLHEEFQALAELSQIKSLAPSAPRPVGLFRYRQRAVLAEHCILGTPLTVLLRRHQRVSKKAVEEDLSTALNWLLKFQQETSSGKELPVERLLESLHLLKTAYPDFSLPSDFLQSVMEIAEEFDSLQIPLVASHGDFWPGNVLLGKNSVGVIDWESFHRKEMPYYDAFMFITSYAHTYPWAEWKWNSKLQAFKTSFLLDNWFSQIVIRRIHEYLQALGIPYASAHLLYSIFLIHMACTSPGFDRDERQAKSWFEMLKSYSEGWRKSIFV